MPGLREGLFKNTYTIDYYGFDLLIYVLRGSDALDMMRTEIF